MSTIRCAKQAVFTHFNLTFKSMLRLLGVFLVLMAGLALPAVAQPVKGSVYKDFLPMGSGASVALPEGVWEATHVGQLTYPGQEWETFTLKNQSPDAKVPFLVVRHTTTSGRWGNTGCLSKNPHQFMVNEHGTLPNQVVNKCSRMFTLSNFEAWKTLSWATTKPDDQKWWGDVVQGMVDKEGVIRGGIFQLELGIQQFNGRRVRIEAFVLPPKGMGVGKFKADFLAGQVLPEHQILSGWTSIYIESMQQSYFNKKPQPIMALAYPVNTGGRHQRGLQRPELQRLRLQFRAPTKSRLTKRMNGVRRSFCVKWRRLAVIDLSPNPPRPRPWWLLLTRSNPFLRPRLLLWPSPSLLPWWSLTTLPSSRWNKSVAPWMRKSARWHSSWKP
jgi:hypothetical protein